ncbi:hypothetical protein SDRG_03953 [Saprolegnia diclina VS20]|uniref:Uncharacterized protein n=1 Tax=Saprolegnia diclina (strain VS20) TaxID=1156394 RepID=T0QY91_SAPDV|nr:hypothetical protein SDRG_03953 [Saprolegnia diclina VS20]EQC39000.1 hypothetical protein SDRG_03953 [Saprolegnia diclina VS20]|eukprot:XP_008607824.1 hypothetical protein SDRG_03953 [Saprolegnia diclina VS20]
MAPPRRRAASPLTPKFIVILGLGMVVSVMLFLNLSFASMDKAAVPASGQALHLRVAEPTPPPHRRIIVLIANYRDTLRCAETLDSLFTRAAVPERVTVSLFDQLYLHEGEERCFDAYCAKVGDAECRRSERLRRNGTIDADQATGPTLGRYESEKGIDLAIDDFVLAIDSHTLFIKHWDTDVLSQWDSIGNKRAIITVYPDATTNMPPDGVFRKRVTLMCHAKIETEDKDSMIQYSASITVPVPSKPRLMSQFAGGFNFGTAQSALDVRNDPHTPYLFHGEEYSKAARLFTHGYDIQDIELYSLGTKRTMEQFIAFSSIDPSAAYKNGDDLQFDNCHELEYVPYDGDEVNFV